MTGKYRPLEKYLGEVPENEREIRLSFEEIEQILNVRLPSSAYESELWWTKEKEGNHVTPRAWANAGWKVERTDLDKKQVTLVRKG